MIFLEVMSAIATGFDTHPTLERGRRAQFERSPQLRLHPSTEVRHRVDLHAAHQQGLHEGVVGNRVAHHTDLSPLRIRSGCARLDVAGDQALPADVGADQRIARLTWAAAPVAELVDVESRDTYSRSIVRRLPRNCGIRRICTS